MDCNLYFFGHQVEVSLMYLILGVTVALLIGVYLFFNLVKKRTNE